MEQKTNYVLLCIGIALILIPLGFAIKFPDQLQNGQFFLRVIASLGGALVGASIPGILKVKVPGVEAAGALAVFALIFLFDPPGAINSAMQSEDNQPPSEATQAQPAATRADLPDAAAARTDGANAPPPGDAMMPPQDKDQAIDNCMASYSQRGVCDWEHWSEMYEACELYKYPPLDDEETVAAVKAGKCSWDNWSNFAAWVRDR